MPRRRRRTTNRTPADQRRLRVRGLRRSTPDAHKLSRAFIGLALARAEADAQAQAEAEQRTAEHRSRQSRRDDATGSADDADGEEGDDDRR